MTSNAESRFIRNPGVAIRQNHSIINGFDQPGAKRRCRDPEYNVIACKGTGEVRLANRTATSVAATGDDEQIMYAAIRYTSATSNKTRLADRAVEHDKRRDCVISSGLRRH